MQQVANWLENLGMSEYAQRFADNDIDFSILGDLTDQDLKDLGIASFGHRRKILRAIAEFDRQEATAAPSAAARAPPSGPSPLSPSPTPVGRDLLNAYLDDASAAVMEMGRHVAKKLDDGLMALFGYPLAHENDAERAASSVVDPTGSRRPKPQECWYQKTGT